MKELGTIGQTLERALEQTDRAREEILRLCRRLTREASSAIKALHQAERGPVRLGALEGAATELRRLLEPHPDLAAKGYVEGAWQEYAEVHFVRALKARQPLPGPQALRVPPSSYLLGLADAIGELRRFALEALRNGRVEEASAHLERMEELFSFLMRFDYPDALVPLKHKQDVARGLVEKTRGEVAVGLSARGLERRLTELLERAGAPPKRRRQRS